MAKIIGSPIIYALLQWQSWVVVAKIVWSAQPKIYLEKEGIVWKENLTALKARYRRTEKGGRQSGKYKKEKKGVTKWEREGVNDTKGSKARVLQEESGLLC